MRAEHNGTPGRTPPHLHENVGQLLCGQYNRTAVKVQPVLRWEPVREAWSVVLHPRVACKQLGEEQ